METPAVRRLNVQLPADITVEERDVCDLEMLLMGAFAPLTGYLNMDDFCSVVQRARLADNAVWPIPIVLPVPKKLASKSENPEGARGHWINLRNIVGTVLARVLVEDCFEPNVDVVAQHVLGTTDTNHPYVRYLDVHHRNVFYVGGRVQQCHKIFHFDFQELRKTPAEIKELKRENNWEQVVGFQTRNPMHRSHFELTRMAVAEVEKSSASAGTPLSQQQSKKPHLLLTPACGPTQPGDIKSTIRIRCYKKLLPFYRDLCGIEATLVLLPLAMRMAGPREAVWHALIRKNFGCTHFIVGRDHAGPSTRKADGAPFYGPYEAHKLLQSLKHDIGITPVFGKNMVYVGPEYGGYVQEDQVPPNATIHQISGTQFRKMLQERTPVPEWFSFGPVLDELKSFYKQRIEQGFCVYFTGLPCSGKSTLAAAVEAQLQERSLERRQVTVFDADIIRLHLSKGLGFTREDRSINVRRIGYVASLVVQHGGICLVANIAPYEEDRLYNRQLVTSLGGGYIEVHVSTPLHVCEERDVKHLYKSARLGVIKQVTMLFKNEHPNVQMACTQCMCI